MGTKPLVKEEKAWLKKLEELLMNPPTNRIGFYTIGDACLHAYDLNRLPEIHNLMDTRVAGDFCVAVEKLDADFGVVKSACKIDSTAG